MISFNYETDFELGDEKLFSNWITKIITSENKLEGQINYIFCNDDYLHKINLQYLNHDTFTDIISFDYSEGNFLQGDIFISIERVQDNAMDFNISLLEELKRVMAHGILHYCGYKDKSSEEQKIMRQKEEQKMKMFHVEQS
ncbi:rRNA maturation RNase YbeY [Flavobacterium sp.]|jgi:probable rRNA maturation factor|uniref:rRNA maturation RNase YbeY n=1 Tax=Flavobacterium sp. TaxID=239 RepID=UPI0037C160F7